MPRNESNFIWVGGIGRDCSQTTIGVPHSSQVSMSDASYGPTFARRLHYDLRLRLRGKCGAKQKAEQNQADADGEGERRLTTNSSPATGAAAIRPAAATVSLAPKARPSSAGLTRP